MKKTFCVVVKEGSLVFKTFYELEGAITVGDVLSKVIIQAKSTSVFSHNASFALQIGWAFSLSSFDDVSVPRGTATSLSPEQLGLQVTFLGSCNCLLFRVTKLFFFLNLLRNRDPLLCNKNVMLLSF